MPTYTTINVKPDADQDDCLTAAANVYIAEHPELDGYDLSPRWADDSRESIELTVPTPGYNTIRNRQNELPSAIVDAARDLNISDATAEALAHLERVLRQHGHVAGEAAEAALDQAEQAVLDTLQRV